MKLGVFTPVLYGQPLDKALEYLHSRGVQMAEIGVGGNPGDKHCKPRELMEDPAKLEAFQELFRKNEIEISALSAQMCIRDRPKAAHKNETVQSRNYRCNRDGGAAFCNASEGSSVVSGYRPCGIRAQRRQNL